MSNASAILRKRQDVDMTQGNILGHIIRFAFPLLIGNLFQQMYNTVDTWVVGNFVNNDAFAAVGAVTPIVNMLIGAFLGLSSGASVVISQFYGAGRHDRVQDTVHTSIVMTAILCVLFTAVGLFITPYMIRFTNLHSSAAVEASTYLSIYFAGLVGLMFYNMGSAILRAIGDSRRPFYFLVICALLNTGLDLLFVCKFHWGVAGVAYATIISQGVSAILVIITLLRTSTCIKLQFAKLKLHWDILKKVLLVGIPAALQMAITSFSNVFVQSYINHFDQGLASSDYMSGWTAYLKVDHLLFLPVQSISLAVTTFVGQNLGSKQVDRAKKGVSCALLVSMAATVILMIPLLIFAPGIVGFLNSKPEVVQNGTMFLRWLSPFYILCCFNQIYASALRGAGNSRAAMVIMLLSFVGFRQLYLFVMSKLCYEIIPIALSYPAGWLVCSLITAIYYHHTGLNKNHLAE